MIPASGHRLIGLQYKYHPINSAWAILTSLNVIAVSPIYLSVRHLYNQAPIKQEYLWDGIVSFTRRRKKPFINGANNGTIAGQTWQVIERMPSVDVRVKETQRDHGCNWLIG